MEQMPHHREGIQNDLDKAYDEGHRDNKAIDEAREKSIEHEAKSPTNRLLATIPKLHGGLNPESLREAISGEPIVIRPQDIDWTAFRKADYQNHGKHTVNPDMMSVDLKSVPKDKFKFIDIKEMHGKTLLEVAEQVIAEYGDTHYIPGIEYLEYVLRDFRNTPESVRFKGGHNNYSYLFGSIFRDEKGNPFVMGVSGDDLNQFDLNSNRWNYEGPVGTILIEK